MRFQRVTELEVVVVLQPHTAQDDDIHLGLQGNARQQLVVGLARRGKNRQFLRFHQRVEYVNHRDARAHHFARDDALGGVHRRPADGNAVFVEFRTVVARLAGAVEHAPQQRIREGYIHLVPQKAHLAIGGNAAAAREHLQIHLVVIQPDHLRQRSSQRANHLCQFTVGHALGAHGDDVARNLLDAMINLMHCPKPPPTSRQSAVPTV
ncbi:MAG: hypothetical protein BWX54_00359 [Verrucomicrobia bacterium ADurb.Bin018]|nr:MAG: hypothetical protein BWX54_00359 [Verrucomicrobia bacterium ADurb.Bin018]